MNIFKNLGFTCGMLSNGRKGSDVLADRAAAAQLEKRSSDLDTQRAFAINFALDIAGEVGDLWTCHELKKQASETPEGFEDMGDMVLTQMGKCELEMEKAATSFLPFLGNASSTAPDTVTNAFLLSLAGGSGLGALWWLANRATTEDDHEASMLKSKIHYYDKVTNGIKNELKRKKLDGSSTSKKDGDLNKIQDTATMML